MAADSRNVAATTTTASSANERFSSQFAMLPVSPIGRHYRSSARPSLAVARRLAPAVWQLTERDTTAPLSGCPRIGMADVLLSACGPPETQTAALGTHSPRFLRPAALGCSGHGGWSTRPRSGRSRDTGGA